MSEKFIKSTQQLKKTYLAGSSCKLSFDCWPNRLFFNICKTNSNIVKYNVHKTPVHFLHVHKWLGQICTYINLLYINHLHYNASGHSSDQCTLGQAHPLFMPKFTPCRMKPCEEQSINSGPR